jgi:hypothetical protein
MFLQSSYELQKVKECVICLRNAAVHFASSRAERKRQICVKAQSVRNLRKALQREEQELRTLLQQRLDPIAAIEAQELRLTQINQKLGMVAAEERVRKFQELAKEINSLEGSQVDETTSCYAERVEAGISQTAYSD